MADKLADIRGHLDEVNKIPVQESQLSSERITLAASIARNPEFAQYIARETDSLLRDLALTSVTNVSVEALGTHNLESRGQLLALAKIYGFFMSCEADQPK